MCYLVTALSLRFAWIPKPISPSLLKVGTQAPRFTLRTREGGEFALSEALSKHKAVLVYFFYGGYKGLEWEFKRLQELQKTLKGLLVVGLEKSGERLPFNSSFNAPSFPILLNGKGESDMVKKYGLRGSPAAYLLDSKGKVVGRWISASYGTDGFYEDIFGKDCLPSTLKKMGFHGSWESNE